MFKNVFAISFENYDLDRLCTSSGHTFVLLSSRVQACPVPPGAGLAKILHVAQIDGRPMPRLLRSLLWLGWSDFGYRTVVWLSSLLLLVRATEPACQHQVRALVGAGPAGRVCQKSDMAN